jgi:hypothetical protein
MKTSGRSESALQQAASPKLVPPGEYDGIFQQAVEQESKRNNAMLAAVIGVQGHEIRDYLVDVGIGALKLRHACAAVGALAKYEAGEISAADFVGKAVRVKIAIEKKRGFSDRNVIEDYIAAAAQVVNLRGAG